MGSLVVSLTLSFRFGVWRVIWLLKAVSNGGEYDREDDGDEGVGPVDGTKFMSVALNAHQSISFTAL